MTDVRIFDLTLCPSGAGADAVHLCLRSGQGRVTAGLTVGPLGPTTVDCSGLVLDGGTLRGAVQVSIGFDGFFPKDGQAVVHRYQLEVTEREGVVNGTFSGTTAPGGPCSGQVTGTVAPAPDLGGHQVLDLQLENGRGTGVLGQKSWGDRVYPKLFLRDGRFVQDLIYGWGGRVQINYFEAVVVANELRLDGQTLTGRLVARTTGGTQQTFLLDGLVVGREVGGTFRKQVDGKDAPGGPFHGRIVPHIERRPEQSLHYLELHQAVLRTWTEDPPLQLMAFVPCLDGQYREGVAYAAAWNHVYHCVEATGLAREGDRLTGELKVTLNPDPYMPPDHQPVPAVYRIDARIVEGRRISGSFAGTCKDRPVSGPIFGELLDQPAVPEPVAIHVKLEEGVSGGEAWHRRTFLSFTITGGRSLQGHMSNNKNGWKGTFSGAEAQFDGTRFTACIRGTVDESKGVKTGAYTFRLTGRVIGSELIGICDTNLDGTVVATGTPFMGGFGVPRP